MQKLEEQFDGWMGGDKQMLETKAIDPIEAA